MIKRRIFNLTLATHEKLILSRMAQDAGVSMSSAIRQLVFAEHKKPKHLKRLARSR